MPGLSSVQTLKHFKNAAGQYYVVEGFAVKFVKLQSNM